MLQTVNHASHLSPAVRAALELSDEERIQRVRSPRWIGYPMAKRVLDRLEDLLTYPQTHRMPGLLLVGETNNGKTRSSIGSSGSIQPTTIRKARLFICRS